MSGAGTFPEFGAVYTVPLYSEGAKADSIAIEILAIVRIHAESAPDNWSVLGEHRENETPRGKKM